MLSRAGSLIVVIEQHILQRETGVSRVVDLLTRHIQWRMLQDRELDGIRQIFKIRNYLLRLGWDRQIGQHMIASENRSQANTSQHILSELENQPILVWIVNDMRQTVGERIGVAAEISLHRFRSKILIGIRLRLKENILKMTRHLDKDFYLTHLQPIFLFLTHRR